MKRTLRVLNELETAGLMFNFFDELRRLAPVATR
jgi:hypothetical protein